MSIEQSLSTGNKIEAIQMALEIIDMEIYSQLLVVGVDPDTFPINEEITIEYFGQIPENCAQSAWRAYNSIPLLTSRRIALMAKLGEINNA